MLLSILHIFHQFLATEGLEMKCTSFKQFILQYIWYHSIWVCSFLNLRKFTLTTVDVQLRIISTELRQILIHFDPRF